MRKKMILVALLAFFSFCTAYPNEGLAQGYPVRPIQIVVPFGAGGPLDQIARLVGDQLGKELKTPVAILNKPGAGGAIGTSFVARAEKDGYTLMMSSNASYTTAILQPKDVSYDMERDFEPIGRVTELASIVLVRYNAPWKNMAELLNDIKKNPKKYSTGTAAIGTTPHFIWATMNSLGFETNVVITASTPETIALLKGGHIDMMVESLHPSIPYIRDKSFRGLAVTTSTRVKELPDVPTFPEAGYSEIGYILGFAGLFAPAGTPKPILDTLFEALQRTMKNPALVDRLEKMSYSAEYLGPVQFKQTIRSFVSRIKPVAEKTGIIKK